MYTKRNQIQLLQKFTDLGAHKWDKHKEKRDREATRLLRERVSATIKALREIAAGHKCRKERVEYQQKGSGKNENCSVISASMWASSPR